MLPLLPTHQCSLSLFAHIDRPGRGGVRDRRGRRAGVPVPFGPAPAGAALGLRRGGAEGSRGGHQGPDPQRAAPVHLLRESSCSKEKPKGCQPVDRKDEKANTQTKSFILFLFLFSVSFFVLFCFVLFVVVVLLTDKSVRPSVRPASSASIHSCVHAIDWLPNQDRGRRRREDDGGAVRSGRRRGGLRVG